MKRRALFGALLASAIGFAPIALAYSSLGAPTGYVNDYAHVLSAGAKLSLESELKSFELATSNQIAVAVVPNMGGDYIENYAVKLFEEWKVGTKEKDNGVLLVVAVEEHKLRIEVGYGLEGALPDSLAQRILDNEMTPRLKAGDYDGAVTAAVTAIEQATKGEYVGTGTTATNVIDFILKDANVIFFFVIVLIQVLGAILARSKSWWVGGVGGALGGLGLGWLFALTLVVALPLAIILALLGLLFDYVVSTGYKNAKAKGSRVPWWAGGSFGSGSSSGGFGGFGDGSSGGGGASGGW